MAARLCTMRSCPNEATEPYCGSGEPDVCERHRRDLDLAYEHEEFEIAREYIVGFAEIAKASGCRALRGVVDLAWAECEMRIAVIEAERRMVWE